jgi:hypothetical protein
VWRAAAARSDVAGCPREHGQHRARQRPEPVCQEEAASQTAPRVREVKPPKAHRRKPLATTSCTQVCRALAIGSWLSALLSALRTSHVSDECQYATDADGGWMLQLLADQMMMCGWWWGRWGDADHGACATKRRRGGSAVQEREERCVAVLYYKSL